MKNSKNNVHNKIITNKDLKKIFWRSMSYEWSWNYERQGNLGFLYAIIPALNKIYKNDKKELKNAYKRHLEFYNITPWLSTFPMALVISMEEENSLNKNFNTESINDIKLAVMGPLSSIGDAFFWGALRIIAAGIGISLSLNGSFLGPILFLLIFNIPAIVTRYYALNMGYKLGASFITKVQGTGIMERVTYAANIVSLAVIGSMIASMVTLYMPFQISGGENPITIQSIFDSIIPGILCFLFTFFLYYLDKKNIKFYWILLLILFLGILGSITGLLGLPN